VGAIVERSVPNPLPQVIVADALRLCRTWRARGARTSRCPSVAVAGSNGKTTAKEMTAAILSRVGCAWRPTAI